jgi:hypothetical protein
MGPLDLPQLDSTSLMSILTGGEPQCTMLSMDPWGPKHTVFQIVSAPPISGSPSSCYVHWKFETAGTNAWRSDTPRVLNLQLNVCLPFGLLTWTNPSDNALICKATKWLVNVLPKFVPIHAQLHGDCFFTHESLDELPPQLCQCGGHISIDIGWFGDYILTKKAVMRQM